MDYDLKKSLINELSKEMAGSVPEDDKSGQITARFDPSTNSLSFDLSGTHYNVKDMADAKKYFSECAKTAQSPEKKTYYEIGVVCIDSILKEFTELKQLN